MNERKVSDTLIDYQEQTQNRMNEDREEGRREKLWYTHPLAQLFPAPAISISLSVMVTKIHARDYKLQPPSWDIS